MGKTEYSLTDHFWAFVGISLVCAIACALVTLGVSMLLLKMGLYDTGFSKPMFAALFSTFMALHLFAPNLRDKLLTGTLHVFHALSSGLRY